MHCLLMSRNTATGGFDLCSVGLFWESGSFHLCTIASPIPSLQSQVQGELGTSGEMRPVRDRSQVREGIPDSEARGWYFDHTVLLLNPADPVCSSLELESYILLSPASVS